MFSGYPGETNGARSEQGKTAYPVTGNDTNNGGSRGGLGLKLIGVIFVAIVAIAVTVAIVVVGGSGSGGGRLTGEQVAQDLSTSYGRCFSSGFTDSAVTSLCNDMIEMMPSEVVDVALEKAGITDQSEIASLFKDYLLSSSSSSYSSYLEKVRVDLSFFVGDEVSSNELSSINKELQNVGVSIHASSGSNLGVKMEITALEDVPGISKGKSMAESVEDTGLIALCIDGKWYLWGRTML